MTHFIQRTHNSVFPQACCVTHKRMADVIYNCDDVTSQIQLQKLVCKEVRICLVLNDKVAQLRECGLHTYTRHEQLRVVSYHML